MLRPSSAARWRLSDNGGLGRRRRGNTWPGWSRGGRAGRRGRTVSFRRGTTGPFPAPCPAAGRRPGTICTEGVANALYAHTFLPIVQRDAVAVVVVTALMYQPPRFAVLRVGHNGQHVFDMICLLSRRTEKCPSIYHYIFQAKRRGLMKNTPLYTRTFLGEKRPPFFKNSQKINKAAAI